MIVFNCFQYWNTGTNGMPPMILYIYNHNLKQSKKYNFNLVLITDENVKEYFEPHSRFYDLDPNFKSDIVRYNVLDKFGGMWLDTDIIITRNLNILFNDFIDSSYDIIIDNENKRNDPGCCSLCMRQNTPVSNFCLKYVNDYLDSGKLLKWGEIGPITIHELLSLKNDWPIKINDFEITKNGCNYISWSDNPGFNKNKWLLQSETDAYAISESLLNNLDCYYVATWTIYRKTDIPFDELTNTVFRNTCSIFTYLTNNISIPTFNILIATIGRPNLQTMLDSLSPQLLQNDCLTIVFDGHTHLPVFDLSKFKCKINQYCEPIPLKYWGHGIRNKYATLLEKRNFVMHADDDDIYTENIFNIIREQCLSYDTLYIYTMKWLSNKYPDITKIIKEGNIGTPCGVIPFDLNKKGTWLNRIGGDGSFYEQIIQQSEHTVVCNDIIYIVRPKAEPNNNTTNSNSTQIVKKKRIGFNFLPKAIR